VPLGRELEKIFQEQNVSRYSLCVRTTTSRRDRAERDEQRADDYIGEWCGRCGMGVGTYLDRHDEEGAEVQTLDLGGELAPLQELDKVRILSASDQRLHRHLVVLTVN
jgi:hypothetical protein